MLLSLLLFTDEMPCKTGDSNNRWNSGIRQALDQPTPTLNRQRNVGISWTLCAGISVAGATDLKFFDAKDRIDMHKYVDVLKFYVTEAPKCFRQDQLDKFLVIEDGAGPHNGWDPAEQREAIGIRPLLPKPYDGVCQTSTGRRRVTGLKFRWPANSPDLNMIENWWSTLKWRVSQKKPATADAVKRLCKSEHRKMVREGYPAKFCNAFWPRVDKCIALEGKYTGG